MILSRTPLRISFFGGGTDVSLVYSQIGGAVFASAFNKYIYIVINSKDFDFGSGVSAKYSELENVEHPRYLRHPIMRQVLLQNGMSNLDISVSSDLPGGSGLGSSSSFTVGFLNAINTLRSSSATIEKNALAEEACRIEIDDLNEPIGKQDAYAASFGGIHGYLFGQQGEVSIFKSKLDPGQIERLQSSVRIIRVGSFRRTSELLSKQFSQLKLEPKMLSQYEKLSKQASWAMHLSEFNVYDFGAQLMEAWSIKKSLSPFISTIEIENLIQDGLSCGATGAKLLGAGGSGYVLFVIPHEKQEYFDIKMSELNPRKIIFDTHGSTILLNSR